MLLYVAEEGKYFTEVISRHYLFFNTPSIMCMGLSLVIKNMMLHLVILKVPRIYLSE